MGGEPRPPAKAARNRVLIIDDDLSVRASIVGVLQGAGYQVFQSGDGQEALSKFDARQIDLLLLDLGLPSQSGWDTFEGFTSRNPLLQVIIITGQPQQTEMAMAAGVGALMEKPLDAADLLQTCRAADRAVRRAPAPPLRSKRAMAGMCPASSDREGIRFISSARNCKNKSHREGLAASARKSGGRDHRRIGPVIAVGANPPEPHRGAGCRR